MPATLSRWPGALTAAVVAAHLVALWSFRFFPSQDGPAHLGTAAALRELVLGQFGIVRDFYVINPHLDPNWLIHVVLALLGAVMPALIAEKLLLSGYLIALPAAAFYAARAARPGAGFLGALTLPLLMSFPVHMGFYNFAWSLPLFLAALGYWLPRRRTLSRRQTAALAGLLLVLLFSHLFSFAMAGLAMAVVSACDLLSGGREEAAPRSRWPELRRRALPLTLAFLPGVLVGFGFLGRNAGQAAVWRSDEVLAARLAGFQTLVSFERSEVVPAAAYFWSLLALMLYCAWGRLRRRQWSAHDGFLISFGLALVLYFCLPAGLAGGGYVNTRVALFLPLLGLLWLAGVAAVERLRNSVLLASAGLALALLWLHVGSYARIDAGLQQYAAAAARVRPNSTVLSLSFAREAGNRRTGKVRPFANAAGYLAARGDVVDLANYQAHVRYFPILYRPEVDPFRYLGGKAEPVQAVRDLDLAGYESASGKLVDYVILWDLQAPYRNRPAPARLLRELESRYELVSSSGPAARLELYQRRQDPPAGARPAPPAPPPPPDGRPRSSAGPPDSAAAGDPRAAGDRAELARPPVP